MDKTAAIHRVYRIFNKRFRPIRMRKMIARLGIDENTTILDVGGDLGIWTSLPFTPKLTLLNKGPRPASLPDAIGYIQGDGCSIPLEDNSFDLTFSNSVIEHVSGIERQRQFAKEIIRVGRRYYVQTPNYYFPIEPHFLTPFFHWYSPRMQILMARNFTLWGWITRPDFDHAKRQSEGIRLVTTRELENLFPGSAEISEYALGLKKSIILISAEPSKNEDGD